MTTQCGRGRWWRRRCVLDHFFVPSITAPKAYMVAFCVHCGVINGVVADGYDGEIRHRVGERANA